MKVNGIFFSIDVLIVPQKNTVVTFAGQSPSENDLSVDVRDITKTASFNIAAGDYISGNTFIAKDGSELCLGSDGEFIYYQSEEDHNKPYCTGTYEVYYGQEAFDKLSTMEEYGLTKAARPFNSRLDKSKLTENGFKPLPVWQDALERYLKEIDF